MIRCETPFLWIWKLNTNCHWYTGITSDIGWYMYLYVATNLNNRWSVITHPSLFQAKSIILNGIFEWFSITYSLRHCWTLATAKVRYFSVTRVSHSKSNIAWLSHRAFMPMSQASLDPDWREGQAMLGSHWHESQAMLYPVYSQSQPDFHTPQLSERLGKTVEGGMAGHTPGWCLQINGTSFTSRALKIHSNIPFAY